MAPVLEALKMNERLLNIFVTVFATIIFSSPLLYSALSSNQNCKSVHGSNVDMANHTIKCNKLNWYNLVTVSTLCLFEAVALTMVLPALARKPSEPHPSLYTTRILDFWHRTHSKMRKMIIDGKIRALVIMTPRVAEDEMDKQIEASCKTCRRVAQMMVAENIVSTHKFRCIVTLLDEDRRPSAFKTSAFHTRTGHLYHETELFRMCEDFSANTLASWFPSSSVNVDVDPPVGGNYKVYVEKLSHLISFEVHYVRRGWRLPRLRRFFEKLWAFGETLKLVKGDNVYWTAQDDQVYIGQVSHCGRRDVAVTVEVCGSSTGKNAANVVGACPTGITTYVYAVC
jgi:hypothetical protein